MRPAIAASGRLVDRLTTLATDLNNGSELSRSSSAHRPTAPISRPDPSAGSGRARQDAALESARALSDELARAKLDAARLREDLAAARACAAAVAAPLAPVAPSPPAAGRGRAPLAAGKGRALLARAPPVEAPRWAECHGDAEPTWERELPTIRRSETVLLPFRFRSAPRRSVARLLVAAAEEAASAMGR
jgi:hypothetical protein